MIRDDFKGHACRRGRLAQLALLVRAAFPPLGPSSSPLLCVCSWLGQRAEPPRAAESESAQQC